MNAADDQFIFQFDNASFHRSKHTMSFLGNELRVIDQNTGKKIEIKNSLNRPIKYLRNYSARSATYRPPDINIMENLWSILQYKYDRLVEQVGQPRNQTLLFEYAKDCWAEMKNDKELISNLFDSVPQRIRKIIYNEGLPINY